MIENSESAAPENILLTFGQMQYCNRGWYDITGHTAVAFEDVTWQNVLTDEGGAISQSYLDQVMKDKQSVTFQFQLRRLWSNEQGGQSQAWCLTSAHPELSEDGTVIGVAGTMTVSNIDPYDPT